MTQSTVACSAHGTTFSSNGACILSFVEEDGELKILQAKEFTDPQKYSAFDSTHGVAKVARASQIHKVHMYKK
jgi:hypothetical protein